MVFDVYLLFVLCLTAVASQPLSICGATNRIVGAKANVVQMVDGANVGNATILNDCILQLSGLTLRSSAIVKLRRRNSVTRIAEDIFVDTIVLIGSPLSQIFVLKPGYTFAFGDNYIFEANNFIIATITFSIPVTTTSITTTTAAAVTSLATSPSPVIPGSSTTGKVYNPAKLVLVTLGSNPNYPNKPTTQDVSFYINNIESPVLTLVRGNDYTFSIMAGARHPFYLTTSVEGGKKIFPDSDETIFLGNSSTWGTLEAPLLLSFTPTEDMPNEFYYQCWNHTRMGWKVVLINRGQLLQQPTIPPLVTDSAGAKLGVGLWMSIFMMMIMMVRI